METDFGTVSAVLVIFFLLCGQWKFFTVMLFYVLLLFVSYKQMAGIKFMGFILTFGLKRRETSTPLFCYVLAHKVELLFVWSDPNRRSFLTFSGSMEHLRFLVRRQEPTIKNNPFQYTLVSLCHTKKS